MTPNRALLFDLDGTLTDNYSGIAASIRYALARIDAPIPSEAMLRTCVGPPLRETFARFLETRDATRIECAIGHYRERYADVGWQENVVYDGIVDMLALLAAQQQRLFLCTAKPEIFARRIVEHFAFAPYFHDIYGADLAGVFDDKAKLLRRLLTDERLDANEAVMIGDRGNDVRAAHANDVCAVGVLWGYGSPQELADADSLVATPHNLARLLTRRVQKRRTARIA
ncbi:MAG TPA: HAD hydrolase-like protein [Casimicrobiaceae bacterium]